MTCCCCPPPVCHIIYTRLRFSVLGTGAGTSFLRGIAKIDPQEEVTLAPAESRESASLPVSEGSRVYCEEPIAPPPAALRFAR